MMKILFAGLGVLMLGVGSGIMWGAGAGIAITGLATLLVTAVTAIDEANGF